MQDCRGHYSLGWREGALLGEAAHRDGVLLSFYRHEAQGVQQGDQSHLPAQSMSLSLSVLTYDLGLIILPSLGCCEQSMR